MFRTLTALFLGAALALPAAAAPVEVTVRPGDPAWAAQNSGGGSAVITGDRARNGNGSIALQGDRTRFIGLGNPFDANSNLGLLSSVTRFTFDWLIASGSTNPFNPDYTPALRLHIFDGGVRSELIWEGAYNGTYGNTQRETWYETGANDKFWRFVTGQGETTQGGLVTQGISQWATGTRNTGARWYSDTAYVSAISVGVGSGTTTGYRAFADDVFLGISGTERVFNFEILSTTAVPVPASLALLGGGLLGLAALRRRLR